MREFLEWLQSDPRWQIWGVGEHGGWTPLMTCGWVGWDSIVDISLVDRWEASKNVIDIVTVPARLLVGMVHASGGADSRCGPSAVFYVETFEPRHNFHSEAPPPIAIPAGRRIPRVRASL